jgi:hypothetical protein
MYLIGKRAVLLAGLASLAFASANAQAPPPASPTIPPPQSAPSETPAPPKKHQATGIVLTLSDTSLVVAKGRGEKKTNFSFVRAPETRTTGTLKRGVKVTVFYHEEKGKKIADRIKILEEPAPLPPLKVTKPPS